MSQPYKICPICDAPNQQNTTRCSTCGATLTAVAPINDDKVLNTEQQQYEQIHGETDLFEGGIPWKGGAYLVGGGVTLAIITCISVTLVVGSRLFDNFGVPDQPSNSPTLTIIPTFNSNLPIVTNTLHATVFLATITQGPPTETPSPSPTTTPTQGPCTQIVQPGDDLIAIIYRCGHRHFDTVVDAVVELNQLEDASRIQEGQTIEVPWPTPTLDPNAIPTETITPDPEASTVAGVALETQSDTIMGVQLVPTVTLQPGVIWHSVKKDENIIMVAIEYGATLRILSELNPEVTFSQCDFGLGTGGENCVVQLFEGQQIRVPAPTPTPTIQPTLSGSETATPTYTPTINAPSATSPSNRAFFGKDDLVTLRWVATGTLSPAQAYLVRVEDQVTGITYSATTKDLFFILPETWHGQEAARHDYVWTVSVVDFGNEDNPYFTTEPRLFTWQGREA